MSTDPRVGVAVQLPEGVYNVVGQYRYSSLALQWWLWELDDGAGGRALLARVGETYYTPVRETCDALPTGESVQVEGETLNLRMRGEAQAEHTGGEGNDFWRARFRCYAGGSRIALYTQDRRQAHCLTAVALDAQLVQVFEP